MTMASRMLRHARRRAGLTQRQLSARVGIPQETIARIEKGHVDPRVTTLDRLLEGCGFALDHSTRTGQGVDRSQIRALLAMPEPERARWLAESSRNVARMRSIARLAE